MPGQRPFTCHGLIPSRSLPTLKSFSSVCRVMEDTGSAVPASALMGRRSGMEAEPLSKQSCFLQVSATQPKPSTSQVFRAYRERERRKKSCSQQMEEFCFGRCVSETLISDFPANRNHLGMELNCNSEAAGQGGPELISLQTIL